MKKDVIAANWKENKENSEASDFFHEIKRRLVDVSETEVIISPSYVSLVTAYDILRDSSIKIAAQNIFHEDKGAFTGEVSVPMVKNFCSYVIVGHSERRNIFGETDEMVYNKLKAVLRHGLKPILCVGETIEQREKGETFEVIKRMLKPLDELVTKDFIIAYEPVWAISCGKEDVRPATPEDAQEIHCYIRELLGDKLGHEAGDVRILYGGSVKPENIKSFMGKKDIDGALVGNASLDVDKFEKIIRNK